MTWKCVVWSIPNIWLMEDTDGDGKADKREVLYGPLGWERDTHGNLSSFRRGADGWLYGTHGFNNESTLRGRDGSELKIQSGNTWRIRLDGSRVEGWTFGQVNPFGLCWDDRGNLFSADCHSSPIYQLLRGAYYPSFGKPHDGLGFAPDDHHALARQHRDLRADVRLRSRVARGMAGPHVRRQRADEPHQPRRDHLARLVVEGQGDAGFPDAPTIRGSAPWT